MIWKLFVHSLIVCNQNCSNSIRFGIAFGCMRALYSGKNWTATTTNKNNKTSIYAACDDTFALRAYFSLSTWLFFLRFGCVVSNVWNLLSIFYIPAAMYCRGTPLFSSTKSKGFFHGFSLSFNDWFNENFIASIFSVYFCID